MSDYKNTLNLPKTEFPMKANLNVREPAILNKWAELNLYSALRKQGKKRKKFIFLDGPPYANGHIHMGTAVNKVLKDIVVKAKTLSGFEVPFIPGWDCHGLPIEVNVEKKVGKAGQKISAKEFRQACRDYAFTQINFQREEFKRLGIIADWDHPYLTMDYSFEANTVRSLAKIFKAGHIEQGAKPVYWCLECASALAEAEAEYKDKTSSAIDVRFNVVDEKDFLSKFSEIDHLGKGTISVPIWTTTPWTLPANQGVVLNPVVEYALVECNDGAERLLIAVPLVEKVMERYKKKYKIISVKLGETFEGLELQHPFYDRTVKIMLAPFVTIESGTGAVHTAPAHGPDDYVVAKKYDLSILNLIGDEGTFKNDAGFLSGMHVTKVNDRILEELKTKNALIHLEPYSHSYPHCWRHKTPLIYRATPQWFISMEKDHLREEALAAIKTVNWVPEWGFNRIYSMVENRPDWCISRQRTWGVPIPVFTHKETHTLHPNTLDIMEKVAKVIEKAGVEAWFSMDAKDLLGEEADAYQKSTDILDVWFDSGVAHECVLRHYPEMHFPADFFLEGSDQHRGWFNSSLMTSVAMNHTAPYKTVLTHGFIIDVEGRKMSKSIGNVIAPEKIIQAMGADVLRLWVGSIDYRGDIFVSDEILARISETYRRLRNTARFLLANLDSFDPHKHLVPTKKLLALDKYILEKARLLQIEIIKLFETYQFHLIYQKLHQFCSIDLGSFYLDIIKDRQYTMPTNSLGRRSTQTALFHIMEAMVRWFAPILSFTAEEIWGYMPGKREPSVFLSTWYEELPELSDKEKMNVAFWEEVRKLREEVNTAIEELRNAKKIGSALEAEVHIFCHPTLKKKLDLLGEEFKFVLITSNVVLHVHDREESRFEIKALELVKCERCWHRTPDVNADANYPGLCQRCVINVSKEEGEVRHYA